MLEQLYGIGQLKQSLKRPEAHLFLIMTFMILLYEYFGWQRPFIRFIQGQGLFSKYSQRELVFWAQVFTSASFLLYFAIIPFSVLKVLGRLPKTIGLSWPIGPWVKAYLPLALFMMLVLLFVCRTPQFYRFYPLYRPQSWDQFLLYELIYMTQFFTVEFFFRGLMLFSFEKYFKHMTVFIMTLPYAFIHIHKPFPEAIGSIVAGVVLGHLALKSKSIWPGVLVHMVIALTADTLGLYFNGDFSRF